MPNSGRNGPVPASADVDIEVLEASPYAVQLRTGGISTTFHGVVTEDHVHVDGPMGSVSLRVVPRFVDPADLVAEGSRSEEHTSELPSLMRISYAVFCLKKKKN